MATGDQFWNQYQQLRQFAAVPLTNISQNLRNQLFAFDTLVAPYRLAVGDKLRNGYTPGTIGHYLYGGLDRSLLSPNDSPPSTPIPSMYQSSGNYNTNVPIPSPFVDPITSPYLQIVPPMPSMLPVSPVVSLARNGNGGYGNNIPGSRPAPARKSNERSRPNWLAWLLIVLVFIAIVIVSIYIFRDLSQTARKGANSPRNASP